jgi:hypothetical protein
MLKKFYFFARPICSKKHQLLPKSTTYDELAVFEWNSFRGNGLERIWEFFDRGKTAFLGLTDAGGRRKKGHIGPPKNAQIAKISFYFALFAFFRGY